MSRLFILLVTAQAALLARSYVYLDLEALYLQRGGSSYKVLVSQDDASILTSKQLVNTLGYEPCFRLSLGASNHEHGGMFRGLIAKGWSGRKLAAGGDLSFPFDDPNYAAGYNGANRAKISYSNNLTLIEGYFTRDFTPLWEQYFAVRGSFGLQYFNIPEKTTASFYTLSDTIFQSPTTMKNSYSAYTQNNLLIAAIGLMLQIRPNEHWAMELIGYGGAGGTFIKAKTNLQILDNTVTLRKTNKLVGAGAYSFLSSVRAVYRPTSYFEIGLGYELIYAGGIALAYKQLGTGSRSSGTPHNASIWYQGASFRIGFKL